MKVSNKELKARARDALSGNYSTIIACTLLTDLITIILVNILMMPQTMKAVSILGAFIVLLLMSIFRVGIHRLYLNTARGKKIRVSDLFYCFSNHPDKIILMVLWLLAVNVLVSLPVILIFFVPGSRIPALLAAIGSKGHLIILLFTAVWFFLLLSVNLYYLLAFYLYLDSPEKSTLKFLRESRQQMQGSRLRYFSLLLSFIGMYLLGILTLGLGFFWIIPYMGETSAQFYLSLPAQDFENRSDTNTGDKA